jgi:hypothetical protein
MPLSGCTSRRAHAARSAMTPEPHMDQVFTYTPHGDFDAYEPMPDSPHRVKLSFRVDFTNGGFLEGEDFLLDIAGNEVSGERAAEMLVSAMNLLRAGTVKIYAMRVVRRGLHEDA